MKLTALTFRPPQSLAPIKAPNTIFLGGSIEMGSAIDWQVATEEKFAGTKWIILNPRRKDWDSSWAQDPTPGTQFHGQVTWELEAQRLATHIIYNFVPDTISPITLMELGLFAKSGKVLVACPTTYFRYGNVKILCDEYSIPCYSSLENLLYREFSVT